MFGGSDFSENEFGNSVNQNLFTLVFNEVITMTDSWIKNIVKVWNEVVIGSEIFAAAKIKTFTDAMVMSEQFKILLNGVSTVWKKATRLVGSWAKVRKQ